jgi:mRNA-degrading endonuclease toxin of MazEF toxin-antitoxin module
MKTLATVAMLALTAASQADEIEPAVVTSSSAAAPAAPAAAAVPASTATPAARSPGKAAQTAKPSAGQKSGAHDAIVLDPTQITGNRELPKVMYVVPWKRPDLGDFAGRPAKSLVDEALAPVDRDVFRRQNRYFAALQADSAARPAAPTVPAVPAAAPVSGDEK